MGFRLTPDNPRYAEIMKIRQRIQDTGGALSDPDSAPADMVDRSPAEEPEPDRPYGAADAKNFEDYISAAQKMPAPTRQPAEDRAPAPLPPDRESLGDDSTHNTLPDLFPNITDSGAPRTKTEKDYEPTEDDINKYYDKKNRGNFVNSMSRIFGGGPESDLLRKKALLDNYQEQQRAKNRDDLSSPDSIESKLARVNTFQKLSKLRDLASEKGDGEAIKYYTDLLGNLPKMSAGQLTAMQTSGGRKPSKSDDLLDIDDPDKSELAKKRADTASRNAGTAEKRNDIREDDLSLRVGKQVNFNPVSTQLQKQKVRINAALQRLDSKGKLDESALSDIEADYAAALAGTGVFSNYKLQQLKQPSFMRDLQKMHRYFANGPIDLRTTSPDIVAQVKNNLVNLSQAYDQELGRVANVNKSMHFTTKGAQDTLNDSIKQYQPKDSAQKETRTYQGKTYEFQGGDRNDKNNWKVIDGQ